MKTALIAACLITAQHSVASGQTVESTSASAASPDGAAPTASPTAQSLKIEDFFEGDRLRDDLLQQANDPALEAQVRGFDAKLNEGGWVAAAKVISVGDKGIIAELRLKGSNVSSGKIGFLFGYFPHAIDGSKWSGKVYPCGRYQYVAANGAVRTVSAYATDKKHAVRYAMWELAKRRERAQSSK